MTWDACEPALKVHQNGDKNATLSIVDTLVSLVFLYVIVVSFSNDTSRGQAYKHCHPNLLLVHPNVRYRNKVQCILHPNI